MKSAKAPDKKRGSVILLVIALLTIVGMLGSTLLFVARLDKRTSYAIASAAPALEVANSVLDQLRAERVRDLHIVGTTVYASLNNPEEAIDYPHENVDKALACIEPNSNGRWDHLTNLGNLLIADPNYFNIPFGDANMVDTDGDGTNDARLFETGITDPEGRPFLAAVRMIDASGLINVNTAFDIDIARTTPMPMTSISLRSGLVDSFTQRGFPPLAARIEAQKVYSPLHLERSGNQNPTQVTYNDSYVVRPLNPADNRYRPFDLTDLVGMVWEGSNPNTGLGRLWSTWSLASPPAFAGIRSNLGTWSGSRIAIPPYDPLISIRHKVDLNWSAQNAFQSGNQGLNSLFAAFYEMFQAADNNPGVNSERARQMTVNVIDYYDNDQNDLPTQFPGFPTFGIERQPFVTELFQNKEYSVDHVEQRSAIELFNPYSTEIDLRNYEIEYASTGIALPIQWPAATKIPPGGRYLFVSHNSGPAVAPGVTFAVVGDQNGARDQQLDLSPQSGIGLPIRIYRRLPSGMRICIETLPTFSLAEPSVPAEKHWIVLQRYDAPSEARYTLNAFAAPIADNTAYDYMDITKTNLGLPNNILANAPGCPMYVRNGPFVSVGELLRISPTGPGDTVSLPERLLAGNTQWDTLGTVGMGNAPHVPMGCLFSEFFMVNSPETDGIDNDGKGTAEDTVYGSVNVNTAPKAVLKCLPAIAQDSANVDRIADEMIAYRDQTGGYANRTAVIANLRNSPGFATSGEVAIAIRQALGGPVNGYPGTNNAPDNYAIADGGISDDGLPAPYPQGDLDKYNVYYKWLSNQVTVRSDTYIAYILVRSPVGGGGGQRDRRFLALIDRTNCRAAGDLPKVLMMAEIK